MNTFRRLLRPGFLVAASILLVSAVGLNVVVSKMQLTFKKLPVDPARELTTIPATLGDWVQVSIDEPIDHATQEQLATERYIFRDYVNAKLVGPDEMAAFKDKSASDRKRIVSVLQNRRPEAVINMAVTYYTGGVDTVAHIPERCYVADGYQPATHEDVEWDVTPPGSSDHRSIAARFINFEDQTQAVRPTKRVAYFFYVDGKFTSDPAVVRETLQDLRTRHGFYSKVELMSVLPDHDQCERMMTDLLTSALPQIQQCWPDWNAVEHSPGK